MALDGIYGLPLYRHQQIMGDVLYGHEGIGKKYSFVQPYPETGSRDKAKLSLNSIMPGCFLYNGSRVRFDINRASGNKESATLFYRSERFLREDYTSCHTVLLPGDVVTITRLQDKPYSELFPPLNAPLPCSTTNFQFDHSL